MLIALSLVLSNVAPPGRFLFVCLRSVGLDLEPLPPLIRNKNRVLVLPVAI